MNRVKILVVCGSLGVGGAEMQAARLLPRLNPDVFDVQLAYYTFRVGPPKEMIEKAGIQVNFLGTEKWNKLRFFYDALALMRQERFDLVHAWLASDNHYGRIPAILAGVPVIIGGLRGEKGLEGGWPLLYSIMNLRCSGWITNSRKLHEIAARKMFFMGKSPAVIVNNGLDIEKPYRSFHQEHPFYDGLRSEKPVVGIVGRLHPVKNHLLFVEMAHKLNQSGVDADYWIIGEGPMRGAIERRVKDLGLDNQVKLLGQRNDVEAAWDRMTVAVLTSDSESCPNVLLEAMRASLPVVSTACTSLEQIIEEGRNGHIVATGDSTALAEKVRAVLSDAEKRQQMGRHSRRIVEQRFSLDAAVRGLEKAYLFFLRRKSKKSPLLKEKLTRLGII